MTEPDIKRGYAKWTDENGIFHKVPVEEYLANKDAEKEETQDESAE